MKKILRFLMMMVMVVGGTILSQIGGVVWILSMIVAKFWNTKFKGKTTVVFIALYSIMTFLIVPQIAPWFGREKIKHTTGIQPTALYTVLLNRNYVNPTLNTVLQQAETQLEGTGIVIHYLDANFPFVNGFPLLPHLSHNDGKKVDISLVYKDEQGQMTNSKKSNSGYGVFVHPQKHEQQQPNNCKTKGYIYYDYPKYLTLGAKNKTLVYSNTGTSALIRALLQSNQIQKLFIEPHLKRRLRYKDTRIRYHGCQAVRHDDHIHIQIR